MSKLGLATKEEAKFFGKVIAGEISVNGVWSTAIAWFLPNMLDNLDDKFGDKLPEPWQTYVENLITKIYAAMQDKVITPEEETEILNECAVIMNAEIDIPLMSEEDELIEFMMFMKYGAALIRKAVKKVRSK